MNLEVKETIIPEFEDIDSDVQKEKVGIPVPESVTNTQKVLKHFAKRTEKPLDMNSIWIKTIMNRVPEVTHISFEIVERTKETFVKIVLKNPLRGKDYVRFKLNVDQSMMTSNEWEQIYNVLKDKSYATKGDL